MCNIKLKQMLDAFHDWFNKGAGVDRVDTAFEAGFKAALAQSEQQEPARCSKNQNCQSGDALVCARTDGVTCPEDSCDIDDGIYTTPQSVRRLSDEDEAKLARCLHYPSCWDTMAYPTLLSALLEVHNGFPCSTCGDIQDECGLPKAGK